MVRHWRKQRGELSSCKKTTKAFRGKKCRWPEIENDLEDWSTRNERAAEASPVQIRLKARTIAAEKGIQDFKGGPSWCFKFLGRRGLSVRTKTTLCQQLPPDCKEKLTNFWNFKQEKIAKNFIGPQDVINMDEVPLTFDLPLNRTVIKKGESSVTLKTTGHEKTHFTCVLG